MDSTRLNLLNEHQRRALSTRLAILDRQLFDAERLVRGEFPSGAMFETSGDLTAEETEKLLALFAEGRDAVRTLRDRFGLAADRRDVRHWLLGHFSMLWNILHDSHAKKLSGFGDVAAGLASELDPEIDRLIEIVSLVRSLVSLPRE